MKIIFSPTNGYVLTIPHEFKSETFNTYKSASGDAQISEVVAIGKFYKDDHGTLRECPCKVKDVILHQYTPNDVTIGKERYIAVHFSQVLAILKDEK